jgi:hypothetical protein
MRLLLALGLALGSASASATLIHSYQLDNNYLDSTGSAHAVLIGGGISGTTDRFGTANSALMFTNSGRLSANFALPTTATFSMWATMSATAQADMLFDAGNTDLYFLTGFGCGGQIFWNTYDSCANPFSGTSGATSATGWHHYVVVASLNAPAELYIDGALVGTAAYRVTGGSTFDIGGDNGGYNWNGKIDDVRIYDTALSASEVASLTANGTAVPEPDMLGLVGIGLAALGVARRPRRRATPSALS